MEGLEDEADLVAPQPGQGALAQAVHRRSRDLDGAVVEAVEPGEDVQQRRFPRAGRADHGHELARRHLQRGAVEHAPARRSRSIHLDEPGGPNHDSHRTPTYARGVVTPLKAQRENVPTSEPRSSVLPPVPTAVIVNA